jgi:hypothetical protein
MRRSHGLWSVKSRRLYTQSVVGSLLQVEIRGCCCFTLGPQVLALVRCEPLRRDKVRERHQAGGAGVGADVADNAVIEEQPNVRFSRRWTIVALDNEAPSEGHHVGDDKGASFSEEAESGEDALRPCQRSFIKPKSTYHHLVVVAKVCIHALIERKGVRIVIERFSGDQWCTEASLSTYCGWSASRPAP